MKKRLSTIVCTALMTVSALANAITANALSTTNHGEILHIYEAVNQRFQYSDYMVECCKTASQIIKENNCKLGDWESYIPEAIAMSSGYPQKAIIDGKAESLTYCLVDGDSRLETAALIYVPYKEIKINADTWNPCNTHFTIDLLDSCGYIIDMFRDNTRIEIRVEDATGEYEAGGFDLNGSEFWSDINVETLITPCFNETSSTLYTEYSVFDIMLAGQLENFALDIMSALSPAETTATTPASSETTTTVTTTTAAETTTIMRLPVICNAYVFYDDAKDHFIIDCDEATVIAHSMSELIAALRAYHCIY